MTPYLTEETLGIYLHAGAVFKMVDDSFNSSEPHFFVVLNVDPAADRYLLLACATSRVDKCRERIAKMQLPDETFERVSQLEYSTFTKETAFDCNDIHPYTKEQFLARVRQGGIEVKADMAEDIVERLRAGSLASPRVERKYKKQLRAS